MTPQQRLDRYEKEGGDPIHKYMNLLIEQRVLARALEVVEGNLLPDDWHLSENEIKRIKHELITKGDSLTEVIDSTAKEIPEEDLEKAKVESSILSDSDIREIAIQKLHTYAGIHHFNEKDADEAATEKLDEDVA